MPDTPQRNPVKATLKNVARGPRAIYDYNRQVVVIPPGKTVSLEISDVLLRTLKRSDGDIAVISDSIPPKELAAKSKPKAEPEVSTAEVLIPENWRDLPWKELRPLAEKIARKPVYYRKHAVEAIEEYQRSLADGAPSSDSDSVQGSVS